jgi:hypothetical protein
VAMGQTLRPGLVGDAGVIGARRAELVTIEVGQVVVIALDALDQLPMPEAPPAPRTHARLGPNHCGGHHVIAGAAELPVGAAAGLFACRVGDVVAMLTMQARDGVGAAATGERDLLKVHAGEVEGPEFAGVEGALVRYSSGVHSCLL